MKCVIASFIVIVMMMVCVGCGDNTGGVIPTPTPLPTSEPQKALTPITDPIPLRVQIYEYNDYKFVYPYIVGIPRAETISSIILSSFTATLERISVISFLYTEEYNDNGILSLRFEYSVSGDAVPYVDTLTFDCTHGTLLQLSDFFPPQVDWKSSLADYVANYAQKNNITLWTTASLIPENRMFYVTQDALVLQYGEYEIAGYESGALAVSVPYGEIVEYLVNNEYGLAVLANYRRN